RALFFSLLSLGPCFRLSPCFCLALLLCSDSGEPLLLRFRSLAFCFSIDCCLCLTLFCFFKPLLLRFLGLALCFGVGSRLGLVRARRIRLLRPRRPRHPHRYTHLIESDPAHKQQRRRTSGHRGPPAPHHQPRCRTRLPKPIILHPWPSYRFAVTHPRWEPYAGKAARTVLCGGRAMKRTSLPLL